MEEYIQVTTTTETRENAEKIASILVQKRLAGCVQIVGPILSTYWWKGAIEKSEEWYVFAKTSRSLFAEIERAIKENHTYETPEIIAVPVVAGSGDYLAWLDGELKKE